LATGGHGGQRRSAAQMGGGTLGDVYATTHGLVTPEAVVLDLPTASPGTRVLARLLDVLITLVVFYALVVLVGTTGILGGTVSFIVAAFGLIAVILVYPVLMEGLWGGRTLGKAALGLRVVRTDGAPIGLVQAALRGAFGLVEVWGTLGSLGFIVMLFSGRDQRVGDMAAGALVLRERPGRALRPVELLVPPGCEQLVMTLDVGAMSADDYELVRSFLVRWRDFAGQQRVAVAATVAGPLWQRFRHPIPAGLGPDYYLACLGAAYQYRHQSGQAAPAQPQWGSPYDAPPRDYGEPSGWPAPR
jgi:uncharacterized RDD family membrane protein YckC